MKNVNSKIFSKKIRAHSLRMVSASNSSHIGSCLSVADIFSSIVYKYIKNFSKKTKKYKS